MPMRAFAGGHRRRLLIVCRERARTGGMYHAVNQISVAPPHPRVHVQYFACGLTEGARPFVSEASALLRDISCSR